MLALTVAKQAKAKTEAPSQTPRILSSSRGPSSSSMGFGVRQKASLVSIEPLTLKLGVDLLAQQGCVWICTRAIELRTPSSVVVFIQIAFFCVAWGAVGSEEEHRPTSSALGLAGDKSSNGLKPEHSSYHSLACVISVTKISQTRWIRR